MDGSEESSVMSRKELAFSRKALSPRPGTLYLSKKTDLLQVHFRGGKGI